MQAHGILIHVKTAPELSEGAGAFLMMQDGEFRLLP
jgi:hypothetical protein